METITTTLTTEAIFNDNHSKRYLLRKVWDENLPKLTVIMLAPSEASGVALDTTTQLCLNNASRLGFGSISIVNLFATINDFDLKQQTGAGDPDNLNAIIAACRTAIRSSTHQEPARPGINSSSAAMKKSSRLCSRWRRN